MRDETTRDPATTPGAAEGGGAGDGAWVVLPTYDEIDNLRPIAEAILATLPGAVLLVVDDASPDGTGDLADVLAAADPRVRVRHRAGKQGLGRAYLDGFGVAIAGGARIVVQMDADWSHDPSALPSLLAPIEDGAADLVIGSRYVPGGGLEVDWSPFRQAVSQSGSAYARAMIGTPVHDCTSGFRCYRASSLFETHLEKTTSTGYFFCIEALSRIVDSGGTVDEVPIVYTDRVLGHSKISNGIVFEAFWLTTLLGLARLTGRRKPHPAPR